MRIPNCIRCDKVLKNVGSAPTDIDVNQPFNGTAFMSHGHYGSTVYDPMNPQVWLEINVCDECMIERIGQVIHATKAPKGFASSVIYEPWNRFKHG